MNTRTGADVTSPHKGYLLVTMEPPAALEEEFNDWYDTEHVPERLAVDGFESATRFVCTQGWPRYLAFYELSGPEVIASPGYQAIAGENFSPWTKRILARVRGFHRSFGVQLYASNAPGTSLLRLLMLRFKDVDRSEETAFVTDLRHRFEHNEILGLRILRAAAEPSADYIALLDLSTPMRDLALGPGLFGSGKHRVDLLNEYARYSGAPAYQQISTR